MDEFDCNSKWFNNQRPHTFVGTEQVDVYCLENFMLEEEEMDG